MSWPPEIARLLRRSPRQILPQERRAFAASAQRSVSAWAREHVVLPRKESNSPGRWNDTGMGYAREIQDVLGDFETRSVVMMCAAQVGKTAIGRNWLFWCIDQKPGNALVVMPREEDAAKVSSQRHFAVIQESPTLAKYVSDRKSDNKQLIRDFGRMWIRYAGANSPASLASDPVPNLLFDETDKAPSNVGREADALSLARERTKTFLDAKEFVCSTPTTNRGLIWREWEQSDKRRFHVPCPHCGRFQILAMSRLIFDSEAEPDVIERSGDVHYECEHCAGEIREAQKHAMVDAGVWVPEACTLRDDGTIEGDTSALRKGYQLSTLYSPFVTWAKCAAAFLRARGGGQGALQNFRNSWEGWIWEDVVAQTKPLELAARAQPYERGTVPEDARVLTCGVDVQRSTIYYSIRAWGLREESWLVEADRVESFEILESAVLGRAFPRVNARPEDDPLEVRLVMVDSNFRTDEVYQWCRERREVARPIRGEGRERAEPKATPVWANRPDVNPRGERRRHGLQLWSVDTNWAKEKLHRMMHARIDEHGAWWLHADVAEEYIRHLIAEQQVEKTDKRTGRPYREWQLKSHRPDNHWLDCEVYNIAAAYVLGVPRWVAPADEEGEVKMARPVSAPVAMPRPRTERPAVAPTAMPMQGAPSRPGFPQRHSARKGWMRTW